MVEEDCLIGGAAGMSNPTTPMAVAGVTSSSAINRTDVAEATMRRVSMRLLPFLIMLNLCAWIDRTNVALAALQMNRDLHLGATAYGFGVGIFFLGYALFEVPSNLILARVGARLWLARIAITWGLIASAMMFVRTPVQFYTLRILLGFAEAGCFPGIIYYLSVWFPARQRGAATARFMISAPLAGIVGNALGGWVLGFDGQLGLRGWQWVFLLEGIPSVVLGLVTLMVLTDRPNEAQWLSRDQREWLDEQLRRDATESAAAHGVSPIRALAHPLVWLIAITGFLTSVPLWAYQFWAPMFVREALHATPATTGLILAGIACVGAAAMLVSGTHSDRRGERCLHAAAGALLAAAGCAGAALLPNPVGRVAAIALVEIGVRSYVPAFVCLVPMLLRGTAAAAGIALVNTVFSLAGFVGPWVVGWFKDATGSTSGAFLILASLPLTAAMLSVLVLRRQPALAARPRRSEE
jgi:MFS transporter, ACS family, tartrate transporter